MDRAEIVKKVTDNDAQNHSKIKMLLSCDEGRVEEVMSHNKLCDIVEEQTRVGGIWGDGIVHLLRGAGT